MTSEVVQEAHDKVERSKKLGTAAIAAVALAVVLFGVATFLIVDQINQNSRDAEQDTFIKRVEDSDPCSTLSAQTKAGLKPSTVLVKGCEDFLRGLADDDIFPTQLVCYIVDRAGLISPTCVARDAARRAKQTGASRGSAADSSAARDSSAPAAAGSAASLGQAAGAGDSSAAAPAAPQAPPPGSPGGGPPSPAPVEPSPAPSAPPAQTPGGGIGVDVCVQNPLLPACVGAHVGDQGVGAGVGLTP